MQTEALTNWRGKERHHQQGKKRASKQRHSHPGEEDRQHQQGQKRASQQRHSHSGEGRIGSVRRSKREQASKGTHILKRRQVAAAGTKESKQAETLTH